MRKGHRWGIVLPVCGGLLFCVMGVRIFGMLGPAFAQQAPGKAEKPPQQQVPVEVLSPQEAQTAGEGGQRIAPARVHFSEGDIEVLQKLSDRRAELESRNEAIQEKEAALAATGQRLEQKAAELEALRQKVESLLSAEKEKENSRISSLVKVYESMKPKDAARIFESLEPDVLLSVVSRMKESKLSAVLAALPAEKAKEITTTLVLNPKD